MKITPADGLLCRCFITTALLLIHSDAAPLGHAVSKFEDWQPASKNNRTFTTRHLEKVFNDAVQKSIRGDPDLLTIENAMLPTFRALPKRSNGMLSHSAASFLVQKYFTQNHHFHIKGPGADTGGSNPESIVARISGGREAELLEAPAFVEAMLEIRQGGRGLTLRDAAAMAATLRVLIDDQVLALLDQAMEAVDNLQLESDMSYMDKVFLVLAILLYFDDPSEHWSFLDNPTHRMIDFVYLARNLEASKAFQTRSQFNPFVKETGFSTQDAISLALDVTDAMGPWQDGECRDMREYLVALDPQVTGRIPLDVIYAQPAKEDDRGGVLFRFAESQDTLREMGALDESIPDKPQVLISNYVLGPGNCLKMQSFHTYCCLSECEGLMTQIEQVVQAPAVGPQFLLDTVRNLTTTSMDEPRVISDVLLSKLSGIAALHGGLVPLHGRLFAQWLHFVFPHECPYPHITQKDAAGNSLTTSFFQQVKSGPSDLNVVLKHGSGKVEASEESLMQWTDEELLPFLEVETSPSGGVRIILRNTFMASASLALIWQLYTNGMVVFRKYFKHGTDQKVQDFFALDKMA